MSSRRLHVRRWATGASAALAIIGVVPAAGETKAASLGARQWPDSSRPGHHRKDLVAHSARTTTVNDTGHLRLLKAFGAVLLEEGPVKGTLPGQTRVRMVVGASVTATFTIKARGGSIEGRGSAVLHSSGRYASFGGSLSVNHGTGRYAHAHGNGKLYGVIDRRTDTLTVQTTGKLSY